MNSMKASAVMAWPLKENGCSPSKEIFIGTGPLSGIFRLKVPQKRGKNQF